MRFSLLAIPLLIAACNNASTPAPIGSDSITQLPRDTTVVTRDVSYAANGATAVSYVAYTTDSGNKKPIVLIVPEWWGLGEYVQARARQLAREGYVAMAVDMYGNRKQGPSPAEAGALATPFYKDPAMAYARIEAALAQAKSLTASDTNRTAAIGYCFGGAMVLNAARLGMPLKGVASFHGNLVGVPPQRGKTTAAILVLHGGADGFVPEAEVAQFKKEMDSTDTRYTFKEYAGATHAFTNPGADAKAKAYKMPIAYNGTADTASWGELRGFLQSIFK